MRIASYLGLGVSVLGFAAFLALIYGAWWAKREADRQVDDAATKANAAIGVAGKAIALVRDVISKAEIDLEAARITAVSPKPPSDPFMRFVLMQANEQLPTDMERARDAVGIASETAVIAQAALDVFDDRPDEQAALGIQPDQVKAARDHLDKATNDIREARSVLGLPLNHPNAKLTDEQYAAVHQALEQGKGVTNKIDATLLNAHDRVESAKQKANFWSLRLAVAATLLGVVGALGQLFMARSCIRGLIAARQAA